MGIKCPRPDCGFDGNEPEWEFCGHCGADLSTASAPAAIGGDGKKSNTEVLGNKPPVEEKSKPVIPLSTTAKLAVIKQGQTGREFIISGESAVIGRWDPDAGAFPEVDLSEDDPGCYVSRHHARIFVKDGRYYIEDLGSTNKTVINKSKKLPPHLPEEIKSGDEIIVGKTFLRFAVEH